MIQVIVTNEFTRTNAGPERRPFKVLTPPERSSAMVIARYANRPRSQQQENPQAQQQDLAWKAVRVGSLFAACAFAFFSFSQRNWFERTGGATGPVPNSIQRLHFAPAAASQPEAAPPPADARTFTPPVLAPAVPQTFALPQSPNLTVTEFNLSVTPEFQSVGNVDLRLTSVNTAANTYDITVKTPRREFYRQDVKLAEHIPLSKDRPADGPELVVGAISQNRVFGYISEPRHRGHRRHRRR